MSTEITAKEELFQPDYAGLQSYLNYVQKRRSIRKLILPCVQKRIWVLPMAQFLTRRFAV
jgi:hypothetical protein